MLLALAALALNADGLSAWEEQCWYTPRAAGYIAGQVRLFIAKQCACKLGQAASLLRTHTLNLQDTKGDETWEQWWQVCLRCEGGTYKASCASCPQVTPPWELAELCAAASMLGVRAARPAAPPVLSLHPAPPRSLPRPPRT